MTTNLEIFDGEQSNDMMVPKPDAINVTSFVPFVSDAMMRTFQFAICTFVCQAIAVFGVVTNVINMVIFVKIGFKDSINISLFALAISDLNGCLTLVWYNLAMTPWFQDIDDLPFDPVGTHYMTACWSHLIFTRITGVITAFITFERCLCVRMPLTIKDIFTPRRVALFNVLAYLLTAASFIPILMVNQLAWVFFPERNRTLVGLVFTDDRELVEAINFPIIEISVPLIIFLLISVCTVLLVSSLRKKAKWRESATVASATKSSDMSSKEKRIATMVTLISTLFIVCNFPITVATIIKVTERSFSVMGSERNLFFLIVTFIFLLESINSAINIFIYYLKSTNYRNMFNQTFGRTVEQGNK